MAKNVRISDEMYALAQLEARLQDRSIAQQLEHWAKLGLANAGSDAAGALEAAIEMTRRLDGLDVRSGRRKQGYFHLIPQSVARSSKPAFPAKYQKS